MTSELEPSSAPERDPAEVVADAARACPVVADLADDGLVATFLPGRRVPGVRLGDEVCEVSVVLRLDGRPLPELAQDVREAVAPVAGGRRVDVAVADVVEPQDETPDGPT